jgi:hypothetical protein
VHNFDSNNSNLMEGVIYHSRGICHSDSNVATHGASNFTLIAARRVDLNANATLVLNPGKALSRGGQGAPIAI